jgi:hypothetical protein
MGSFVADHLMVFIHMPESDANIEGTSYYIANIANEFARHGVTPIFIIEPFGDGRQLNLGVIKRGDHVAQLDKLYALLKNARGLTDDKLGILVPYPEINTPAFNRSGFTPTDLPILVNQYFDTVKKYFPNVRGSILLDAKSYDVDKTWGQGQYVSFSPYVSGINPLHVESFGLQGFPWVSADATTKIYDPQVFLPMGITTEAANLLGSRKIWFNTGTLKRKYPSNPILVSPSERDQMMGGILSQAVLLQGQGFATMVHIFAEDKFDVAE